jgi:hypothetical protein
VRLLFVFCHSTIYPTSFCKYWWRFLPGGDRSVDGLKQSLEEAIKEMQGTPAAARPAPAVAMNASPEPVLVSNPVPVLTPEIVTKTVTVVVPASVPEPAPVSELVSISELVSASAPVVEKQVLFMEQVQRLPEQQSIEQALATAPSVSPHYVPPPPPPPAPHVMPIAVPSLATRVAEPAFPPVSSKEQMEMKLKGQLPIPLKPEPVRAAPMPPIPPASRPPVRAENNNGNSVLIRSNDTKPKKAKTNGHDFGDVADRVADKERHGKKTGDNVWRWTTIGISCAGGLASGWIGSNVSDQAKGIFEPDVPAIVGKASDSLNAKPPVAMKMARVGQSDKMLGNLDSKTDRALPMDDNLCTVLELDRGTGLTLAKPCKPVVSAEFNSTLGKSDLIVKPK